MRIFLISNMYPTNKTPNYGVFVKNFCDVLEEMGISFPYKSLIRGRVNNVFFKFFKYILFAFKICYFGLFGNYDLMYIHQASHSSPFVWLLLRFKRFRRFKIAINFHGDDAIQQNKVDKILFWFSNKVVREAELIIVPSHYFAKLVGENFNVDASKIFISPSAGVDTSLFVPNSNHKQILSEDLLKIIYVGRIDEGKGLHLFLEALVKTRDCIDHVWIIGSGALERELKLISIDYGLSNLVEFVPMQHQNDLVKYLHKANVFVFPSERESLGLVGLEAMASGLPVIGSNIPGIASYLKDGFNGYLFNVNNSSDLSEKLKKYRNSSFSHRFLLSENAIGTAAQFDKLLVAKKLRIKLEEVFTVK